MTQLGNRTQNMLKLRMKLCDFLSLVNLIEIDGATEVYFTPVLWVNLPKPLS